MKTLKSLVALVLVGTLGAVLLAAMDALTRERIELMRDRHELSLLTQLISPDDFDNELVRDRVTRTIAGFARPVTVYRARMDGESVALLVDVTTTEGYSGDIRLVVAIDPAGTVIGVRALEHRETRGVGDRIEISRSDWIRQFVGRSLGDPEAGRWRPDRRAGDFDTLSNATITSSAVTDAVRRVLEWFAADPVRPFELESDPD